MKMMDKDKEYTSELAELKQKLKVSEEKSKNEEMVVMQAKRTSEAYMELTDKYVELEKKYEMRSGDSGKDR
jgi:predicted nuclease with TOPRIM domain